MQFFVVLVIFFCHPEFLKWLHFCGNFLGCQLFIERGNFIHDDLLFYRVLVKNDRPVLRAVIGSLPIGLGHILRSEIHINECREVNHRRVVIDHHRLSVAGCPGVGIFVSRIFFMSSCITGNRFFYAFDAFINRLYTPEAAGSKISGFQPGLGRLVVITADKVLSLFLFSLLAEATGKGDEEG